MVYEVQEDSGGSMAGSLMVFMLGMAVGACVAMLYAPQAGSETRAQIAEKATQVKDKVADVASQVAEKTGEWRDKMTSVGREAMQAAEHTVDIMSDSGAAAADRIKSKV